MAGRKVLVTGCAGFIGSHLVDRLLQRGDMVVGVDNFDPYYSPRLKRSFLEGALRSPNFTMVEGDILEEALMERTFSEQRPEVVVHLAAKAGVRESIENPGLYSRVNVEGTALLLRLSVKHGAKKFVFASTSAVYGARDSIPFREDDPCETPASPYGATKRGAEVLCYTFHHLYQIPVVVLRFFTVYGPRQRPDMAIHKFTRQILRGQPVTMYGDGTSARDYTYIDDIIEGVLAAIDRDLGGFVVINLGDSRPVRLRDLIATIEEALGMRAEVRRLPDQPGDVPITCASIDRARELLSYEPKVSLEEGVRRFVKWYFENKELLDAET